MATKTTLRERLATYDFANCEQGATIETNWRLVKDEPISTRHDGLGRSEDEREVYVETDRQMAHFAPKANDGRLYKMEDGKGFRCLYKLTPVSTDADGNNTGYKTLYYGTMYDGKGGESLAEWLDITAIKNRVFGRQAWTSQKGPRTGAIPTSRKEVLAYSEEWSKELLGHLDAVEKILGTYTDGYTFAKALDFTLARRVCKFKARKHAEALYAQYEAERAEEVKVRKTKALKRTKVEEITSAEDMLKVLAAQGISLEALLAAASAQ